MDSIEIDVIQIDDSVSSHNAALSGSILSLVVIGEDSFHEC